MGPIASQIISLTIVYSTMYSGADQSKHQIFGSLAFGRGISRWPVNSPDKWSVTRKMFPFGDVVMKAPHQSLFKTENHGWAVDSLTKASIAESISMCLRHHSAGVFVLEKNHNQTMTMKIHCLDIHTCFASPALCRGNLPLDYPKNDP